MPLASIRQQVRSLLDGLTASTPVTLLVHGGDSDLDCLRVVMGVARESIDNLSPRNDEQPALQPGRVRRTAERR